VFTLVIAAAFAGLAAWLLAEAIRRRSAIPLLALAGGVITCVQEPMLDVLGHVYFPANLPGPSFTAFGRPMPYFIPLAYGFYAGAGSYAVYRLLAAGTSRRRLLALALCVELVDVVFELPWTAQDIYAYYSAQPLEVLGFPLWWVPLNGNAPLIGGLVLYLGLPRVAGAWRALAAAAPPVGWGISYGSSAWPIFVAMNSGAPAGVRWLAAFATIGLAALVGWAVIGIGTRSARQSLPAVASPAGERSAAAVAAATTAAVAD